MMHRRRRAFPLLGRPGSGEPSGIIVIDKPQGVTSHDVVAAVRSVLHLRRVGHAGTLDPMATGALVVGFGQATRLLNYIVDHDKTYEATIRLGQTTDTDDADGRIMACVPVVLADGRDDMSVSSLGVSAEGDEGRPLAAVGSGAAMHTVSRELIERVISSRLTGDIKQVPSKYSAIKVNGRRAYDLARSGEQVELKARDVTIDEFTVLDVAMNEAVAGNVQGQYGVLKSVVDVSVRVVCSAGTYIRSLGRDLGEILGVGGHLVSLRRTRIGKFDVAGRSVVRASAEPRSFTDCQGENVIRNRAVLPVDREELLARSLSMLEAVKAIMPVLCIDNDEARDLRYGRRLERPVDGLCAAYVTDAGGEVVALLEPAGPHECKPAVVFPSR